MTKTLIAWMLSCVLITNLPAADVHPLGLRLEIVSGDHAVNSVTSKANVIPAVVRVRDAGGAPVAGVKVRFELTGKPGLGIFEGEQSTVETETNVRGDATATGYKPLRTGDFAVVATAYQDSTHVSVQIHQRNHAKPYSVYREHSIPTAVWAVAGIAAVGAVVGLAVKSRGSGQAATISVGSPTLAGPH